MKNAVDIIIFLPVFYILLNLINEHFNGGDGGGLKPSLSW